MENLKGLRLTAFYDDDHPVKGADRERFVGAVTFEHKYVIAGYEYLDAKDNSSATKPVVKSDGWSLWAEPRTRFGLEGLFRYDDLKPNKSVDAEEEPDARRRHLLVQDHEGRAGHGDPGRLRGGQVRHARSTSPTEKRFEIKTLFNY